MVIVCVRVESETNEKNLENKITYLVGLLRAVSRTWMGSTYARDSWSKRRTSRTEKKYTMHSDRM